MTFSTTRFFPLTVIEWNKLGWKIKNSESIETFKQKILSFTRPSPNSTFNCHNPKGIKVLSGLRLGLSHLREYKFKRSFQDSLNPFCSCGKDEVETSSHYLHYYSNGRTIGPKLAWSYYNKMIRNLLAFYFRRHFFQQ